MLFRFSLFLKSVAPLQAYVSDRVQVLYAPKEFCMAECLFGDEAVHVCSLTKPASYFSELSYHDEVRNKAVDAIRAALRAFQGQFGYEVKQTGEDKRRAVYSVDLQFDADRQQAEICGFSFAPADDVDYNQVFGALFLDEIAGLAQI